MSEIPTTNCKGCDARDEIIRNLATEIDRMRKGEVLELPPLPPRADFRAVLIERKMEVR